jgi:cytochrome c553
MKKLLMVMAVIVTASLFVLAPKTSSATGSAGDGAATFKAKCAGCHGADGSGNTPYGKREKLRDLGSAEVQAQSDDQLYNVTAKGKGKMPGYEKSLGAAACKELVAHMRKLKH